MSVCVRARKNGGRDPDGDQLTQQNFARACRKSTFTVLLSWIGLATTLVLVLTSFAKQKGQNGESMQV